MTRVVRVVAPGAVRRMIMPSVRVMSAHRDLELRLSAKRRTAAIGCPGNQPFAAKKAAPDGKMRR